jgi:hypothetical protein
VSPQKLDLEEKTSSSEEFFLFTLEHGMYARERAYIFHLILFFRGWLKIVFQG